MNKLDLAYDAYWNHPRSRPPMDSILVAVRAEALNMTHSEDIAQIVTLVVFQKLESFVRADATAFSRWVRTIIKRTRLEHYRSSSDHTKEFDENSQAVSQESTYIDTSKLPEPIQLVAHRLLAGYNLTEIAGQLGVTSAALRNKLARFRKAALRNAA
ncbi:RNA polymerase sigma factor [Tunturiibacter psychrotolerans]|uniref:RNA polymerase sigma factor n=1 Tax=Tunturiibacter psychrotolerans TaxID=3069686 RepID=UPI003D1CE227